MQTYNDLQDRISRRLARNDLDQNIPDFVALAEKAIAARLRVREMEEIDFIGPIDGVVAPPSGFLAVGEIRRADLMEKPLEYLSPKIIFDFFDVDNPGRDEFWSILGGNIYIAPKPPSGVWGLSDGSGFWGTADGASGWGSTVQYWMRYFSDPAPLTPDNQTNGLFPRYSDLYFDATLAEAFSYIRNFDLTDRYTVRFRDQINTYNRNWMMEKQGEGALQMTSPYVV